MADPTVTISFTHAEYFFLTRALTHVQVHAEQAAKDFRCEPPSENIAQSYDADAARAAALLVRLNVAFG